MGLEPLAKTARQHAVKAMLLTWAYSFVLLASILSMQWGHVHVTVTKLWVAAISSALLQLCIPLTRIGERHVASFRASDASGRLVNVAEEISISTGHDPGSVLIHESEIPNVGGFPTRSGTVVMATTGAVDLLDRAELQALVAAQFAGFDDAWCRRATRAECAWRFTGLGALFACVLSPITLFLIIPLFMARWVEHSRDLCADVAAIRATMHPHALATGLRDLRPAAQSAHQLEIGSFLVSASPFLVLPKRTKSSTSVGAKGDEQARSWTSADEIAADLSLRADRAEQLAAGGNPVEFTGREFRKRYSKLGIAPTLTDEERTLSDQMAQRLGVPAPKTDTIDLAKRHFADDHPFWGLHEKVASGTFGVADFPQYLAMTAELHTLDAADQQPPPPPPNAVPSGWYHDPYLSTGWRWWDGAAWTSHVHEHEASIGG